MKGCDQLFENARNAPKTARFFLFEKTRENGAKNGAPRNLLAEAWSMRGADHKLRVQLMLLERRLGLVDRGRTRATGVVAPPAPPYLPLSHGEEFEERVRLSSEAAARFDFYVELLCLEAVDRVVVEYFDVSVGRGCSSSSSSSTSSTSSSSSRSS